MDKQAPEQHWGQGTRSRDKCSQKSCGAETGACTQHRVWETQDTRLKLCNRVLGFLSSWAKDAFLNGPSAGNWVVGGHHS